MLHYFSDSEMTVERAETDAGNVKEAEAFQLSEEMKRGLYNRVWIQRGIGGPDPPPLENHKFFGSLYKLA